MDPVRTKRGHSLGIKFAYREAQKGPIKTHKSFRGLEKLQEERVQKLEERNHELSPEVAETMKAMQEGTATPDQVRRTLAKMEASLRLVNRALDHERTYFGPVTFERPEPEFRRSADRLDRLYSLLVFRHSGRRRPVGNRKIVREKVRRIYGGGKKVIPLTPEEIANLKKPKRLP